MSRKTEVTRTYEGTLYQGSENMLLSQPTNVIGDPASFINAELCLFEKQRVKVSVTIKVEIDE